MITIDDVLSNHEFVFIDSSIKNSNTAERIYDAKCYEELDIQSLNAEISQSRALLTIMQNKNIATIPEVTAEIRSLVEIISQKIRWCNEEHKRHQKSGRYAGKGPKDALEGIRSKKKALSSVQNNYFDIYRASKRHEVGFDCTEYRLFIDMIDLLDSRLSIMNPQPEEKEVNDKKTDIRLVAAVYYACMVAHDSPCLVEMDSDFLFLFKDTTRFMGSDAFLPFNQSFREALTYNQYRLFYANGMREGKYYVSRVDHPVLFLPDFTMNVGGYDLKQGLLDLWQKFPKLSPIN